MIGCCCGEGNSKIYRSFILRRNNLFYHFLRPGQGQAIRKRMVLPAKLLPAARKSKNISLSNLVIFSTIQILTSPYCSGNNNNSDFFSCYRTSYRKHCFKKKQKQKIPSIPFQSSLSIQDLHLLRLMEMSLSLPKVIILPNALNHTVTLM